MDNCARLLKEKTLEFIPATAEEDELLANLLFERYSTFGGLEALETSIFIYRRLVSTFETSLHSPCADHLLEVRDALGEALSARYEQHGEPRDISA